MQQQFVSLLLNIPEIVSARTALEINLISPLRRLGGAGGLCVLFFFFYLKPNHFNECPLFKMDSDWLKFTDAAHDCFVCFPIKNLIRNETETGVLIKVEFKKLQFSLHSFPLGGLMMLRDVWTVAALWREMWNLLAERWLHAGRFQWKYSAHASTTSLFTSRVFLSSASAEWINAGNTWTHTLTNWCTNEEKLIEPMMSQLCKQFFRRWKHTDVCVTNCALSLPSVSYDISLSYSCPY